VWLYTGGACGFSHAPAAEGGQMPQRRNQLSNHTALTNDVSANLYSHDFRTGCDHNTHAGPGLDGSGVWSCVAK